MGPDAPQPGGAHDCGANAAPYVLGALSEQEANSFRVHMESCVVCREEVSALRVVAAALPAAAPQLSAPSALKRRVMSAVQEDLARAQAGGVRPTRTEPRRWGQALRWRPALGLVAVGAAILAVAIAMSGGAGPATRVIRAQVYAPRASASLRLSAGHAELIIANMPQVARDRVYEVWIQRGGAPQPTNALFSVSSAGAASVSVPGALAGARAILVTSEPLGGSRAPTRSPVIVASL